MSARAEVIVVGAGLAGLSCARELQRAGVPCLVLEAADAPGGRVRTDDVDGFRLDRGFQVLLTAYPEAERAFDYDALDLRAFRPGALVRTEGALHRMSDPWRRPSESIATLRAPVGTFADKLRIGRLRRRALRGALDDLWARRETTSLAYLRGLGFTPRMIERFFRPFFGGVFLDSSLETSSRMLEFCFRMFATGDAVLPARGMGALAAQLAGDLADDTLRLNTPVRSVQPGRVTLADGETLTAAEIVVATDGHSAARLTRGAVQAPAFHATTCLYFAADEAPVQEPILVLNGEGRGLVNNLCVPSRVAPEYAPARQSLVSVTVLGSPALADDALAAAVRRELADWFGPGPQSWRHLRTYRIHRALPDRRAPISASLAAGAIEPGLHVCGDHCENGSIQGALLSGRRTAKVLAARLEESAVGT